MAHPIEHKVNEFPKEPGVYLMKGEGDKIIYVGKAINLRSRVKSYFKADGDGRSQIGFLMKRVRDIEYLVTNNEKEALLLENSLIKKHKPRYNFNLKDDKTYVSLKLSLNHEFPKLSLTRNIKKDGAIYFGPYTNAQGCRQTLDFIYTHFKLRTCSDHELSHRSRPCLEYQIGRCSAPCVNLITKDNYNEQVIAVKLLLEGKNADLLVMLKKKMWLSSENHDFETAAHLRDLIKQIESMLEGQLVVKHTGKHQDIVIFYKEGAKALITVLTVRDGSLMDSKYYPLAVFDEDNIMLSQFLSQYYLPHDFIPDEILVYPDVTDTETLSEVLTERRGKKVVIRIPKQGEKAELIELGFRNAQSAYARLHKKELSVKERLEELQIFLGLPEIPNRIECYDISNISGKFATASRVVFVDGVAAKNEYRHYKIKYDQGPNDYAMMAEVLARRFQNADSSLYPNLLMVDGGRGQLNCALAVLKELKVSGFLVIGIAKGQGRGVRAKGVYSEKKEEEIYIPNRLNPIIPKRGSSALMLLQNIRDESHRFAIEYHRKLRSKNLTLSFLDPVEGIGPSKKKALYSAFKSEAGIRAATIDELASVSGMTLELATRLFHYLH